MTADEPAASAHSAEHGQIEQQFIDLVLDTPVAADVAALGLRVKDVVAIARWLAPAHRRIVTNAADVCCTCHTGDGDHEEWCVALGVLGVVVAPGETPSGGEA